MGAPEISIPGVEVLEELGRGTHNTVFRARRQGRYYAIKVPNVAPVQEPGDGLTARFLKEAVALARVRHPSLPAVMEVGHAGRLPYIIMELVAGETLAERLRRGPLDEGRVIELGAQLGEAIAKIHEAGLVHRDIKPQNILFDSMTAGVRLIDFGFVENSSSRAVSLSTDVAPPRTADVHGDLLALGAVLFQCAIGAAPFVDVDPRPILEPVEGGTDQRPRLSPAFGNVLARLLIAKGEPYHDARTLTDELRGLARNGNDVGSRPPPRSSALPLLGRQRELERLRSALRAATSGQSQVVVVRGPAGSGKTHLIRALLDQTRTTHRHLLAGCEQSQREPFGAVRKLVEGELLEYERASASERLRAIGRFRNAATGVAPVLRLLSAKISHLLRPQVHAPVEDAGTVSDEALAAFLSRLFDEGQPRLIIIDDAQWLDAGSRRVLGHLAGSKVSNILYVLAGRDDAASWPAFSRLLRTLDLERTWELVLDPLGEEQTGEFLRSYLGTTRIDDELLRYVHGISDGTPLGVLQIVHSMLEGGALVPFWGSWKFEAVVAARLELPKGSLELLLRRLRYLDDATVELLEVAAVVGMTFEQLLLERASASSSEVISSLLAEARRGMLVEPTETGYRFFHDAVREALLLRLSVEELRALHQRIAEALDDPTPPLRPAESVAEGGGAFIRLDLETAEDAPSAAAQQLYRLATHYAEGELDKAPKRSLEVCLEAGKLAFRTFDSDLALRLFEVVRICAAKSAVQLDVEFELMVAEAQLRTGALEDAVKRLAIVVDGASDPVARAQALSRAAWAEMQIDMGRAWQALVKAFEVLGERAPSGSPSGLARAVASWLRRTLFPRPALAKRNERARLKVLCQLQYQATRLALYMERPTRVLESVLRNLLPAERLGPSGALSDAYLSYSFVLTGLRFHGASQRYLREAERVARATEDPAVYARCLQIQAVVMAWGGNTREAIRIGARSLEEYGHWRELSDYCQTAYNQQQLEGLRGRNLDAWKWLEHALAKLVKHEGPAMALEFIELSVRAALTAVGRANDATPLLARLADVTTRPQTRGTLAVTSYGSRVRLFTECADLGEQFEALVTEIRGLRLDPRKVHLEVTEYYVHVAHARVHACLRASDTERPKKLESLREAHRELALAARIPVIRAHALVVEAYIAFFGGHVERSEKLLERAERLGSVEGAPWVLYAVHRARAHALRGAGIEEAALDEARIAEALAREHSAAHRVRWVREEFGLRPKGAQTGSETSPFSPFSPHSPLELEGPRSRPRPRGYLRSLVRIGQHTAQEFGLAQQAKVVLAELIDATRAERGFLFLTQERLASDAEGSDSSATSARPSVPPPPGTSRMIPVAAQNAAGRELPANSDYDQDFLDETLSLRQQGTDDTSFPNVVAFTHEDRAIIAASLMLRGEKVGAVYLDRPLLAGTFGEADCRALSALAIQVPLVFELARFLREREQVEETQRSAEKLEAIARLAGGIAHDFNNMLSVILAVSDQILTQRSSRSVTDDVKTVQSAAERARDLTRQLLAFSRGQYLRPEVFQLNDLAQRLEPIFRQLLGEAIQLELRLEADLCRVRADPAQFDQVLTNLVVNARDAMPQGGTLLIETANFTVQPKRGAGELDLPPGRYARLSVTDSGTGMDSATLAKAFEPFFTTKSNGSGLGLPTAYGIVKQSGGHLDVNSRVGVGTTFRILLPETEQRPTSVIPPAPSDRPGTETVLLVDDEPLVREATRRTLRSLGYQVIGARSADDALKIAADKVDAIDLVITDVMMPGMNGLELARELGKIRPALKVLFISGYTAGVLAERGFLHENLNFLQKPVARDALAGRIRELLDAE
jgi:signal transduction histidine kinase/CheY-like chemotaxis protein/tetratricopeptide (TPR) repeat protein